MKRDYYDVLGVSREASAQEIKKRFRVVARELHPDVNAHDPEAEEKFKAAAEAYEVLSDVERRRTYDAYGHDGLRSGGFSSRASAYGSVEDLFEAFFGGGGGSMFGFGNRGPAPGADVGVSVEVTLEEVLTGVQREVVFDAVRACETCRGNGAEPGTPIRTCENCDGAGQLRQVARSAFGQVIRTTPCEVCGGDGKIPESPCETCHGRGRIDGERTWEVEVPPGIESGQRIRIAGAGHAGETGAASGDLYVEVIVSEDERFTREGRELVTIVDVSAIEAMVGGSVSVATLDGERDVEVPAGSQPGEVVRLDGLGLPDLRGRSRGAQHVVLNVVVPKNLSEEQRELAERLDETIDEDNLVADREGLLARLRRVTKATRG
ncbi:MAG: molecular chaperone DnaJ [Solirubrobacterales bacterium]|jgi:molecular chaperone DnaJ|nr:molecular chaperone DnaJ [Solirubrobacterales bacterium]